MNPITAIALPCRRCVDDRAKHSAKTRDGNLVLRCRGCGGGYAVSVSNLPRTGPSELYIQAIGNLVVNRLADVLPPDPGSTDEETPDKPQ